MLYVRPIFADVPLLTTLLLMVGRLSDQGCGDKSSVVMKGGNACLGVLAPDLPQERAPEAVIL